MKRTFFSYGSVERLKQHVGDNFNISFSFKIKPFCAGIDSHKLESVFQSSEKTDGVLVVGGGKMHINKSFLSFHSDYFERLFNAEFEEKSLPEIEIPDVSLHNLSCGLASIYPVSVQPTDNNAETLLVLADRFMLPAVTSAVERYLLYISTMGISYMFFIADKFDIESVIRKCLEMITKQEHVELIWKSTYFSALSDSVKARILNRLCGLLFK